MNDQRDPYLRVGLFVWLGLLLIMALIGGVFAYQTFRERPAEELLIFQHPENPQAPLNWWWGEIPQHVLENTVSSLQESNIHPEDYIGPNSCRNCHPKNFEAWSKHPHRFMNQMATEATVVGDFNKQSISYMGGTVTFYRRGRAYMMHMKRDAVELEFVVTQTIGSRFYQYYVGRVLRGPYRREELASLGDCVLPFGYWLDQKEWVPVVHVGNLDDKPDQTRTDPFDAEEYPFPPYHGCNTCHTTFPLAETFSRAAEKLALHLPTKMHWDVLGHFHKMHPTMLRKGLNPKAYSRPEIMSLIAQTKTLEAPRHAVTLGVSCEACHLGAREHAEGNKDRPEFFPKSPLLHVESPPEGIETGRSHSNLNWACARCHAGHRPKLAAGMSTWNSTEYSDATRGSCYSQMRCIDCHEPHTAIGPKWSAPAEKDDAVCLKCHSQFADADARRGHTRHLPGSDGDRCMNCHMPRINEGLQDMVRTHMIFSPTNHQMLESNQPNACNMCHTRENIGWTLKHLKEWYGAEYDSDKIDRRYQKEDSVAVQWTKSHHEAVRLIGADSLIRQMGRNQDRWALAEVIEILDDPFLINRQFTRLQLERLLDLRLEERFGYRFYMTPQERREPMTRIRKELLGSAAK